MNYTSIEQSRKLLEFGLNPDTADMFYDLVNDEDCISIELRTPVVIPWIKVKEDPEVTIDNLLPCWSIGALINVLPGCIEANDNYYYLLIRKNGDTFTVAYDGYLNIERSTFIQALCEVIIILINDGILFIYRNN